jgi:hypothetical protein
MIGAHPGEMVVACCGYKMRRTKPRGALPVLSKTSEPE